MVTSAHVEVCKLSSVTLIYTYIHARTLGILHTPHTYIHTVEFQTLTRRFLESILYEVKAKTLGGK